VSAAGARPVRLLLSGALGAMGAAVRKAAEGRADVAVAACLDAFAPEGGDPGPGGGPAGGAPPLFRDAASVPDGLAFDVVVDFSHPSALGGVLALALGRGAPAVLATTGYTEAQQASVREAAARVPVFQSANMSLGVNLVARLAREASEALGAPFDAEVVELHHRLKLAAPSGTALMLAQAVREGTRAGGQGEGPGGASGAGGAGAARPFVYDRHERRERRPAGEIGIHSLRGGTVVGEHAVVFAGPDEVVEIRHSACSKGVFAEGALRAALFLAAPGRAPGLYSMRDLL
jgi:4-hydroxy-tetrahydrodipicolinate reductase